MKLAGAYVNDETYERLAALAAASNRTLAGQCRHLFDRALRGDLPVPDCTPPPCPAPARAQPQARSTRAAAAPGANAPGAAQAAAAGHTTPDSAVPGKDAVGAAPSGMAAALAAAPPAAEDLACATPCTGRCAQGKSSGCATPSVLVAAG